VEINRAREVGCGMRLLLAGLLILSLGGWLRLALAISNQAWLEQFGVAPGVAYIAVTGGLVGAAAALAFWALAAGYRWAPAATRIIVTVLALGYWADRLLFTQSSAAWANWPFMLVLTLVCLGCTFLVLWRSTRR